MTSSRESTPCPSRSKGPQDERMLTDDEPAGPDDFPRTKEEFRKRCAEMMSGLKKHLTETHRLVAQLKKLHHQTAQQKLKVVSASVLNEQPKVWKASTSASYKRHSRLSENKKNHFLEKKDGGPANPRNKSNQSTVPMSPGPSSQPAPEDESTDMETEIPSPAATINTVRVTTEEKHRELLNMLLIPKRPALNHAVNSWRNKIPKE
ncbi:hypothetical protein VP01_131g8 [Puccinia sorghi]|uniref:Uncharacterized protein n=1 Tax=Puccinia sorghi TaxID=27349 RepID=A0A0L6VN97_9BASI|nr:hypothetical protein VP01_131g8 [Puccinia sorghi]